MQGRLQQRHEDDGQILQQGDRTGVHRFQGQHLAAHDQEKEEAHQGTPGYGTAVQTLNQLPAEQSRQKHKGQQKPHRQHIEGIHGTKAYFIEHKGGAAGDDHRCQQHFRSSLRHFVTSYFSCFSALLPPSNRTWKGRRSQLSFLQLCLHFSVQYPRQTSCRASIAMVQETE